MIHVFVILEAIPFKVVTYSELKHSCAVLRVHTLMRDNLVNVVPVITKVRLNLPSLQALQSNRDPAICNLKCLLLRVPYQVNEVVDLLGGMPQCKLLLLAIEPYLGLLLDESVQYQLNLLKLLHVLCLLGSKHFLAPIPYLLLDLGHLRRLLVVDILHANLLMILPFELVNQSWCEESIRFIFLLLWVA